MATAAAPRLSAEERREEILQAAIKHFGKTGLHGTSTETIAREVGVSQPYLFRLFGTKKKLFLASVRWTFQHTTERLREAAEAATDQHDAFRRIGYAYEELIGDRRFLDMQLQAYASTHDPDIRRLVNDGFEQMITEIIRHTQASPEQLSAFVGRGMLLNVISSMGASMEPDSWASILVKGCIAGVHLD